MLQSGEGERGLRFEAEGENGELRIKNEEIRRVAVEGEMPNVKVQMSNG